MDIAVELAAMKLERLEMKRPYQIAGVVLLLFSAWVLWESLRLSYYTALGPGPGFFPFWLSILLGLLSVIMLYQATFQPADPMPEDFFAPWTGYLRIAAIVGAWVAVVVLMNPLGFRLTMLAFLLFLISTMGRTHPVITVVVSLAGSFGVYQVFVQFLGIPLPIGFLNI
jgi:putative tricarboxylic transport membrane protein